MRFNPSASELRLQARREGAEGRIAKAAAKRQRKNAKRAENAELQRFADLKAREALEMGIPRGLWFAGVYSEIVDGVTDHDRPLYR